MVDGNGNSKTPAAKKIPPKKGPADDHFLPGIMLFIKMIKFAKIIKQPKAIHGTEINNRSIFMLSLSIVTSFVEWPN